MRKILSPAMVVLLIAGLTLTGCASKKYVDEKVAASDQVSNTKIGEVQSSVEANQKAISDLEAKDKELEGQIAKLSETAADALKRATEAGVLAKGKMVAEVVITDNDATFGFDKSNLSDEGKAALDAFASKIKDKGRGYYIEVQGHTDNIGSESYNLKLGRERAERAMRYLNTEQGIPLHRMNVISYGEYKPIADNSTREGRAQNRRVALVVLE